MKKTEHQILILAACAIIICLLLVFVGENRYISSFNDSLMSVYNIMTYLSMIFSAVALMVAALAFKQTAKKPKLQLGIVPLMSEEAGLALAIDKETNIVTTTSPLSSWDITLYNKGKVSAKNPIVKIRFKDAYFGQNQFDGWVACEHARALGYYGFQWSPKQDESQVIHPGFPYKLPTMYFSGTQIEERLSVEIFIAADEVGTIQYESPVKLTYI